MEMKKECKISGQDEDRFCLYEKIVEKLGLKDHFPGKITIMDVTTIDMESNLYQDCSQRKPVEFTDLPWILLRRLLRVDCEARDHTVSLISESAERADCDRKVENQSDFSEIFEDDISDCGVNPLDLFIAVYQCCDPMLQQLLFQKCYLCKMAVPFIYTKYDLKLSSKPIVSVWPLRCLSIESKAVDETNRNASFEVGVLDLPTHVVTFARLGRPSHSKSQLLNGLLSENKCKTFFDKNSSLRATKRVFSKGLVEIFWLPTVGNKKDRFIKPTTFLNCRGSLDEFQNDTIKFVSELSDVLVLMIDIKLFYEAAEHVESCLSHFSSIIIMIVNPMEQKYEAVLNTFSSLMQAKQKQCFISSTFRGHRKLNLMETVDVLQKHLQNLTIMRTEKLETRILACSQIVETDEDISYCQESKRCADEIIQMMKTATAGKPEEWKGIITPIQTHISKKIGALMKKQQRAQKEEEAYEIESELKSKIQLIEERVTTAVQRFAHVICSQNETPLFLHFFLGWLKIMIEQNKSTIMSLLLAENRSAWENLKEIKKDNASTSAIQKAERSIKETEESIERASFSIEHLFREIGHIYNASLILNKKNKNLPPIEKVTDTVSKLILCGYTFELVDGEGFFMPGKWIEEVLNILSVTIEHRKVLTLSVLGLQSSGKSTLLNTMFGSQFAASSGRCTRGINMQLIPMSKHSAVKDKIKFEYVLVVDTEGLRAPELCDSNRTHDNELATFITGLGDVTVLNIMGENTGEINDILHVIVHAFIRLKQANKSLDIRKLCYFVHQNVSSILASGKTKSGLRALINTLDKATKESAQMEGMSKYINFNQVIEFDMNSQVLHMPNLWQGNPPMAAVNSEYSEKVADLKCMVIKGVQAMKSKSYKSLGDLVIHIRDLWKGVLSEDFVFSFRNNIEIKAYIKLQEIFKKNQSEIENHMYEQCILLSQKHFSKSKDRKQLDEELEIVSRELLKILDEKQNKWESSMKDYFKTGDYLEVIEQWKSNIMNRIEVVCVELGNKIKVETAAMFENRAVEILTTMDKTHEDELFEKSWKIAKSVKEKENFSTNDADRKFEEIWSDFTGEFDMHRTFKKKSELNIKDVTRNRLFYIFGRSDPVLKRCLNARHKNNIGKLTQLRGSYTFLGLEKDDLNRVRTFTGIFKVWKKNKRETVEDLFSSIDLCLDQQCQNNSKITEPGVQKFFENVEQLFTNFHNCHVRDFTFCKEFKVKIFIQASECAGNVFESHNSNYNKKYSPEARRECYKQKVKSIFFSFLQDRQTEDTAATEFSESVKSFVYDSLLPLLSWKVKVGVGSNIGSVKYHFTLSLLTDLLRKNEFESFNEYNKDPRTFVAKWVTKQANDYLFSENSKKYFEIASGYVTEYFEDVKKAINKTAENFSAQSPTVDEWLEHLTSNLQKCKIPDSKFNLFKNILQKKVDFKNFQGT